jgi:Rrf2 family protein
VHLLAQEEYGLRCLLQVAQHRAADPLTIPEIAEAEGLSPEYTAKLMRALRQGGLVTSTRGPGGGYRLARGPDEVTAWEVIAVLGGSFFPDGFCDSHPGVLRDCIHTPDCSIRSLWRTLEGALRDVLERITLADLQRGEHDFAVWVDGPDSGDGTRPSEPRG